MPKQRHLARRALLYRCTAAAVASVASLAINQRAHADPFYMGSDISLLSYFQQIGATYKANGQTLPADQILYDAGDNLFRLRVFVNPNTSYSATQGAIQTTAYDIALAQQIKANDPGAQILLDFHYSDTWADPGHQTTPPEWGGSSASLASLETNIYNNTFNTLQAFAAAGVTPTMVQLGNEINSGLDWNTGLINFNGGTKENTSWANLGALLNQGIAAVRAVQGTGPKIQVAIHIANGAMNGEPQYYFNEIQTLGGVTDYDIEGVSFYPGNGNSATLSLLQSNLTTLANTYPTKKIMVLETNYPYENFSGNPYTGYANTPAGQQQELSDVANVIKNLPHNAGEGVVYWYPEGIQVPGLSVYNGGATALFDSNGNALASQSAFGITLANQTWNPTSGSSWSSAVNWSNYEIPRLAGNAVTFGPGPAGIVTLDSPWTVGSITFASTNSYTLAPGTAGTLVLDNSTATAIITNTTGSHSITAPIQLNSNLKATVTTAAKVLTLSGDISGPGALTISGAGTIVLAGSNSYSGLTTVASGTLTLNAPGALPAGGSLLNNATVSILGGVALAPIVAGKISGTGSLKIGNTTGGLAFLQLSPGSGADTQSMITVNAGSTLDITNNKLLINYGSNANDPVAAVAANITSGYNNGFWLGSGIISTTAAANPSFSIGYLDGNNPKDTTAATIGPNQLAIKYTLSGDAFLENTVGFDDLVIVAQNFGSSGHDWAGGNFTYDPTGSVGFADLVAVAQNFGFSSSVSQSQQNGGTLSPAWQTTAVNPEPASVTLLTIMALGSLAQRKKRRN